MNIKVTDKSTGATKVAVRVVKPIWTMSDEELIKALDLKKEILDYHYNVEQEYKNVDDIYSDTLVEYIAELLYGYYQDAEFDGYVETARRLVSVLEDEVTEEIYGRDENARDDYEAREEGLRGDY